MVQATFGGLRLFFNFTCLPYIPIGDALTLIFSEPLFTIVLSYIFLRIGLSIWKLLLCACLLAGMILSVQPPFLFFNNATETDNDDNQTSIRSNYYSFGAVMAICCAVCGALCNVSINKCPNVHSVALVFLSGVAGAVISIIGCLLDTESQVIFNMEALSLKTWSILVLISVIGVLAYFSMTESLKYITPTSLSVLRALEIVFAYACQIILLGQMPDWMSILGASLVMLSVIGIAMIEKQ